jgi:hypothetical protein
MKDTAKGEEFLNIVLLPIHPTLHHVGSSILQILRNLEETKDIASLWTSVFTGIAVISNRETPIHLDFNGRPEWYDLLTVKGSHSPRSTRFDVPEMGLTLAYGPGTVIAVSGQLFQHGVKFWGDGDRICYARFMREEVRKRFGVDPGKWMTQSYYAEYLSKELLQKKGFIV